MVLKRGMNIYGDFATENDSNIAKTISCQNHSGTLGFSKNAFHLVKAFFGSSTCKSNLLGWKH